MDERHRNEPPGAEKAPGTRKHRHRDDKPQPKSSAPDEAEERDETYAAGADGTQQVHVRDDEEEQEE